MNQPFIIFFDVIEDVDIIHFENYLSNDVGTCKGLRQLRILEFNNAENESFMTGYNKCIIFMTFNLIFE